MVKLNQLSIKAKLQILLLVISLGSILVVGYLAWQRSRVTLQATIFNQLTSVRASKSYQIESYFNTLESHIRSLAEDKMVVTAMDEFSKSYNLLEQELKEQQDNLNQPPPAENFNNYYDEPDVKTDRANLDNYSEPALKNYYETEYFPRLTKAIEGEPDFANYRPKSLASRYLQYHYIANNPNIVGEKNKLVNAGDGSEYSKTHQEYHQIFSNLIKEFGYYDLFLIDPNTLEIVYTVYKEADYATNLQNGPYRQSNLAEIVEIVQENPDRGAVQLIDFKRYYPSYAAPAAFFAAPIYDGANLLGIIAIQIPIDEINNVLTQNQNWKNEGLGDSGETYLVGEDKLMRSASRFLIEDENGYLTTLSDLGTPEEILKLIKLYESSILLQKVDTVGVRAALKGESGIQIIDDYRGVPVLSSYAPINLKTLKWAILSEIDLAEAYAPVTRIQRQLFVTTVILIVSIALIAGFLADRFIKPIRIIIQGTRKVSQGELDMEINLKSGDEFGQLAHSFNEMLHSIRQTSQLMKQKEQENESLLLNMVPMPIAERMKKGEDKIVEKVPQATVMFANLLGLGELTQTESMQESTDKLNELFGLLDQEAQTYGIEPYKTIGDRYIGVCGAINPRLDDSKRVMDFAIAMQEIIDKFNESYNTHLVLRIGINAGSMLSGLIGVQKFMYYFWGDTVEVADQVNAIAQIDTIMITESVYDQLHDLYTFIPGPELQRRNGILIRTWILAET